MRENRENGGGAENERDRPPARIRDRSRSRSPRRGNYDRRKDDDFDPTRIYITNIPYEMRWMELKDLLREKGGEVKYVEMLEDRNGKSKGCAVAEFVTRESASKAVESLHRHDVRGRMLLVKRIRVRSLPLLDGERRIQDPHNFFAKVKEDTGIDFLARGRGSSGAGGSGGGRPERGPRPERRDRGNDNFETYGLSHEFLRQLHIELPLSNRVFIANLTYTVTAGKLYDVFSLAGRITWLDIQCDHEGKSKGLAVVQYLHPIEAVQAVSMLNGSKLFDRALAVKIDRFDREDPPSEGQLPRGLSGVGLGLGANGAPLADISSVLSSLPSQPASAPVTPFVQTPAAPAVPSYATPVAPFSNVPAPAPFNSNSGGYNAPAAYNPVSYNAPAAAPPVSYQPAPAQPFAPATNFGQPSYAAQSAYSEEPKFNPNATSRVLLIRNLPPDYSWKIVHDRVSQLGEIEGVDMVSPGTARVRFALLGDAERARNALQGSTVEGRPIHVEFL